VLQSEFSTESDLVLPLSVYRENGEIKLKNHNATRENIIKGFGKASLETK
jgi:hypothetical protein